MRSKLRLLALIVLLLIVLYPLFWMVGTSLKSPQEIATNTGLIPETFTPGNFPDGWHKFDVSVRPVLPEQRHGRRARGARQLGVLPAGRVRARAGCGSGCAGSGSPS